MITACLITMLGCPIPLPITGPVLVQQSAATITVPFSPADMIRFLEAICPAAIEGNRSQWRDTCTAIIAQYKALPPAVPPPAKEPQQ